MKTTTADEVKKRLDAGEQLHLLDVREDYERAAYNIGGTHVPLGKIQAMILEDIEDWKEEEIIIYCRSGNRSGIAAMFLEQLGYKNPVNLTGGMISWQEKYAK